MCPLASLLLSRPLCEEFHLKKKLTTFARMDKKIFLGLSPRELGGTGKDEVRGQGSSEGGSSHSFRDRREGPPEPSFTTSTGTSPGVGLDFLGDEIGVLRVPELRGTRYLSSSPTDVSSTRDGKRKRGRDLPREESSVAKGFDRVVSPTHGQMVDVVGRFVSGRVCVRTSDLLSVEETE